MRGRRVRLAPRRSALDDDGHVLVDAARNIVVSISTDTMVWSLTWCCEIGSRYRLARMRPLPTGLPGLTLIELTSHGDDRGFFLESYREDALAQMGITEAWVQDNHSRSTRGVLRGLHFSIGAGQAKLVRCARGAILDVAVDLRRGSPTFGRWESFVLDDVALRALYLPVGFAHGFCVLSEVADVVYKCSSYYSAETERGVAYDDPAIGVEWPEVPHVVSARDASAPRLADVRDELPFVYGG